MCSDLLSRLGPNTILTKAKYKHTRMPCAHVALAIECYSEMLLKKKAKADAVNKAKMTPLHLAAAAGSLATMDVLLKASAATDVEE